VNRSAYYELLKGKAREIRAEFGLTSPQVRLSDLRRIYKAYGIRIDLWPYRLKKVRGAYFPDEFGPSVLIAKSLPPEPRIFTLAHELKHHIFDGGSIHLDLEDMEAVEIGAEVFAAELIFPESAFCLWAQKLGIVPRACKPTDIVRLKKETRTTLSYLGLVKRAYWLGYAIKGSLDKIKWKNLEEEVFGEPLYKKIQRQRKANTRLQI
jgi:Zn-dependent peptidase ImmA (M78 family)